MQDDDIHIVLRLVKDSIQQWSVPVLEQLAAAGPDPFKILVACILSLRTRDQTTAEASARLFALSADPFSMAKLKVKKIEKAIFPVGFYRTKAQQIRDGSKQICQEFQGKVPDSIEDLVRLPGVGRKTANLVRTVGYKKPGICVDIHVHRICNRLGYVLTKNPDETECVLRQNLPKKHWITFNSLLVPFGQNQCTPISPRCSSCPISPFCQQVGISKAR
jgi:endonuclease-3